MRKLVSCAQSAVPLLVLIVILATAAAALCALYPKNDNRQASAAPENNVMKACAAYLETGGDQAERLREFRICAHGWYEARGKPAGRTVQSLMTLREFVARHPELGPPEAQCVWYGQEPGNQMSGVMLPVNMDMPVYPGAIVQPC